MMYIMRLSKNKHKLAKKKKRHYFIALVSLLFVETGPQPVTRLNLTVLYLLAWNLR